jgi:hypothetical protein
MSLSITGYVNNAASIPAIVPAFAPKSTLKSFGLFKQFKLSKVFLMDTKPAFQPSGMRAFNK